MGVAVAGSHNRTVASVLPVASRTRPSGRVTDGDARHRVGVAGEGDPDGGGGGRVPQPHRGVGAAGGQQDPAVRQGHRGDALHRAGVAGQRHARAVAVATNCPPQLQLFDLLGP